MQTAKNVLVIGGGFIGCELASSFAKKGLKTTIIEVGSKILGRVFDEDTAVWVQNYFEKKGIRILTGTVPSKIIEKNGRAVGVESKSGEILEADFVIVGIGISPNVELAKNAGLKVDNGIWCDEYLQTSDLDVYAAGDVANFYSPVFKRQMRLEHYDLTIRQGKTAGANMTGRCEPLVDLPYFFSFMFDIRIEVYGDMGKYDNVVVRGRPEEGHFVKLYLLDGVVNAVMLVNSREDAGAIKKLILSRHKLSDFALLKDQSTPLGQMLAKEIL